MAKFVKPNNDRIFYLFSNKSQRTNMTIDGYAKTIEYRWDIPDITLNDSGKLTLIGRTTINAVALNIPCVIRITNISSKDTFDTSSGSGEILEIGWWDLYNPPTLLINPSISISPQTINSFIITINDNPLIVNNGFSTSYEFCLVLKLTEGDNEVVQFGSTNNINVNQRQIPKY